MLLAIILMVVLLLVLALVGMCRRKKLPIDPPTETGDLGEEMCDMQPQFYCMCEDLPPFDP